MVLKDSEVSIQVSHSWLQVAPGLLLLSAGRLTWERCTRNSLKPGMGTLCSGW